jgi:hypothetical protein
MAIAKGIKRETLQTKTGLVYYFNIDMVTRAGNRVFVEDFITNTMDVAVFYKNFQQHNNSEGQLVNSEAKNLWDAGLVQVGNSATLKFFLDSDPEFQKILAEYNSASDEDKKDVYITLADVGLDNEGALEAENAKLRSQLEELQREASTKGRKASTQSEI